MSIRKILKNICAFPIKMYAKVFPYKKLYRMDMACYWFRTMWVCGEFRKWGERSRIGKIALLMGQENISVGDNTYFEHGIVLTAWTEYEVIIDGKLQKMKMNPDIEIGDNCHFGEYNHISASNGIQIGNNCLTGKWVTITDNAHGDTSRDTLELPPVQRPVHSKGRVVIGNKVWIGNNATILPGVTIGDSAVIAANSVVTSDIPAFCVAAGIPAKVIKKV